MSMKVASFSGVKVYNLSTGTKALPELLSRNKKRALAKDSEHSRRIELIQDLEMPTACGTITMTGDGEHLILTGVYPPCMKCFTVSDLALKFQRGLTSEVVATQSLSDDFSKLVFLQNDRTLSFHAAYGKHYEIRVPQFGRDIAYHWETCDLFVAATGNEVFRLNLEIGSFKEPLECSFHGCNKLSVNTVHRLLGVGGEDACCELWDLRSRKPAAKIHACQDRTVQITALKFDSDGLTLAMGTSSGSCMLYDIRSRIPLYTKEHQYDLPIIDVSFHSCEGSRHILSTDKKIVKIWSRDVDVGRILTNIETPVDINAVHAVADKRGQTGLLLLAGEQSQVMTYFVPQLGPAPRWCSFLEGITEELEESAQSSAYEDFKFVTRTEVEELGATQLIGTAMLRSYMHGYFMEMRLYSKLRAVSKPFEYEELRKRKIKQKVEEKREGRIIAQKRLPRVNKDLAVKMERRGEEAKDDRFAALFSREEFQQDPESVDFMLRNPTVGSGRRGRGGADDSDDELVDGDAEMLDEVSESDDEEEEGNGYNGQEEEEEEEERPRRRAAPDSREEEEGAIVRLSRKIADKKAVGAVAKRTPKMFELAPSANFKKIAFSRSTNKSDSSASLPLSMRVSSEEEGKTGTRLLMGKEGRGVSGRAMSYVPRAKAKMNSKQ